MTSESNKKKGIVSFLANLPLIRRVKIIKELTLEKLDQVLARSNNLEKNLEKKTNAILDNNNFLLAGLIEVLKTLKIIYQQSQNYYHNLVQIIQDIHKNLTTLLTNSQSQTHKISVLETQLKNINQDFSQQISIVKQEILIVKTEIINNQNISEKSLKQQQKIEDILNSFNSKKIIINESSYTLKNPEIGLMTYLYSFLPNRSAIDIGANIGDVSESLLKAGYEVYSFEPFLPTYEKLTSRLKNYPDFHSYSVALGATNETREFYLATDKTADKTYQDSSLYNSLIKHSMPEDLPFTDTTTVTVKTLASFHDNNEIPPNIGLVKIDTEGFDLQVIEGMKSYKYPVVITEFWNENIPFGVFDTHNKLEDLVAQMRHRNYHWYIVIYRVWGDGTGSITSWRDAIAFYCNKSYSVKNSWGNIFFFQDYHLFQQAHRWTTSILPETYFH